MSSLLSLPGGVLSRALCFADADALVAFACASSAAAGLVRGHRPFIQAQRRTDAAAVERTRVLAESLRLFSPGPAAADERSTESVTFEFNSANYSRELASRPYLVSLFIPKAIKLDYFAEPAFVWVSFQKAGGACNSILQLSSPTILAMMEPDDEEVDILPHTVGSYLPIAGQHVVLGVHCHFCRVRAVFAWSAPPSRVDRCVTLFHDDIEINRSSSITKFSLDYFLTLKPVTLEEVSGGGCVKALVVIVTADYFERLDDGVLEEVTVRVDGAREATFRAQDLHARRWGGRFGFRRGYVLPIVPALEVAPFKTLSLKLRANLKRGADASSYGVTLVFVKGNYCLRIGPDGLMGLSYQSS